ncbi:MAG: nuclear transport factor 2 family protein [Gaiellaceae bacterium]
MTRRVFDAFRQRNGAVVAAALARDSVWRVGGTSSLAGEYRGRREVTGFLGRTTHDSDDYSSELRWVLADDQRAVALYRARGRRRGRTIDIDQLLVIRCVDGRWADVTALPLDQAAFDAFWA